MTALIATSPNWSVLMTRRDAVIAIMRAASKERASRTELLRLERACRTLGLTDDETTDALAFIGYDETLRERLKGAKG